MSFFRSASISGAVGANVSVDECPVLIFYAVYFNQIQENPGVI
jgi:hypothetical protein